MMFFESIEKHGENLAVVEGKYRLSYVELAAQVKDFKRKLPDTRQSVCLIAHNNVATLVAYLACLQENHCTVLASPQLTEQQRLTLCNRFRVNLLIENGGIRTHETGRCNAHQDACLLLNTSGSTGVAKQVVLSAQNLHANATSICQFLPIGPSDKAIMTLPFSYAYGLSVINSHLRKGAAIVFTAHSLVNRAFWQAVKEQQITSFAGVPHTYDMLHRLRFTDMTLPSLRYFTQAGGKLAAQQVTALADYAKRTDKQFFVMYGQTEATARMAFLSPEKALTKPGSIGKAIPSGELSLHDSSGEQITDCEREGELYYRGPNVMLGYAQDYTELTLLEPLESLATGDLAYRDSDGDYYIVGRKKRFIKIFGERVSLDELQQQLTKEGVNCYCCGTDNLLVVGTDATQTSDALQLKIGQQTGIHPSVVRIVKVPTLPVTQNGKPDYGAIMRESI